MGGNSGENSSKSWWEAKLEPIFPNQVKMTVKTKKLSHLVPEKNYLVL